MRKQWITPPDQFFFPEADWSLLLEARTDPNRERGRALERGIEAIKAFGAVWLLGRA